MSVATHFGQRSFVLARRPVPIVLTGGGLAPLILFAAGFAAYSAGGSPLYVLAAAALGGTGGAASLIVHELGHVRAARRLEGVQASGVSLMWMGAATHFEGAYRSGRQQAKVAFGGPAASLAFALALMVAAALPVPREIGYACFGLALVNTTLAILTLLPLHPFDGHKLVVGLVWSLVGGEVRARRIVRRVGLGCITIDVAAAGYVLVERPLVGGFVILMGVGALAQRRLCARPVSRPPV